jgi:serine phosphatase RsbU (regulator of sigma subunit)
LPWGLETGATGPAVALEVLAPGDRLLFYTDGVVESKKTSPESAFGLERLADLAGQTTSSQLSPGQS